MRDRIEMAKRGRLPSKPTKRHPYAAMDHRVMDSPAYADMGFSGRALLHLMTRQLTKDNNGHLQATFSWCKRYGFGSEHTLRAALAEVIAHGFVYRSRSHGANGAWAHYALTWLPVKKRDGLFMDGFKAFAYRDWQPEQKKSSPQKLPEQSSRKCSFTPQLPAESAGSHPAECAEYEVNTMVEPVKRQYRARVSRARKSAVTAVMSKARVPVRWVHPFMGVRFKVNEHDWRNYVRMINVEQKVTA